VKNKTFKSLQFVIDREDNKAGKENYSMTCGLYNSLEWLPESNFKGNMQLNGNNISAKTSAKGLADKLTKLSSYVNSQYLNDLVKYKVISSDSDKYWLEINLCYNKTDNKLKIIDINI
jgi:hypothetical protein